MVVSLQTSRQCHNALSSALRPAAWVAANLPSMLLLGVTGMNIKFQGGNWLLIRLCYLYAYGSIPCFVGGAFGNKRLSPQENS